MVNDIEPTFEEKAIRQWVTSASTPSWSRGNGIHVWWCKTFRDRKNHPPRIATEEDRERVGNHQCTKCGSPESPRPGFKCLTHNLVLTANGTCDECDQQ